MESTAPKVRWPLVLASASPRRRDILQRLGFAFTIEAVDIDESVAGNVPAHWAAEDIASRKLRAVLPRVEHGFVVAADTIVVAASGEILGKPVDAADARRMLGELSGTTHRVITAVAFGIAGPGHEWIASAETRVTMRELTAAEIAAYVDSGEPFGKAGSYAIQETGDRFVTRVDGGYDNVVGLPSDLFSRLYAAATLVLAERSVIPSR
jgi:septum formation protein